MRPTCHTVTVIVCMHKLYNSV